MTTSHDAGQVTAVVINYNGGDRVVRVVRALRESAPDVMSIIVVDNGSTDGSAEALCNQFEGIQIIALGENLGLPRARNIGISQAATQYVLLLDADVYITPSCVGEMVEVAQRFSAAVVCPRIVLLPGGDVVQCDGATPHFIGTLALLNADAPSSKPAQPSGPVGGLIGAAMLLERRQVLDAGGFNELHFFYLEDLEFSLRMRLLGHDIVLAPAAVVEHDRGSGTAGLSFRGTGDYPARRAYLTLRNRWLTIALCYSRRSLIIFLPAFLVYEAMALGFALSRGFIRQWLSAWKWLIQNRREISEQRRMLQARRVRPDRELFGDEPLPLTAGLLRGRITRKLADVLSAAFSAYWRIAARWT